MNDTWELEQEIKRLEKENWMLKKGGKPKTLNRNSLRDMIIDNLVSSKALKEFTTILENRYDSVDLRDIRVELKYTPSKEPKRFYWHKRPDGTAEQEYISSLESDDGKYHLSKTKNKRGVWEMWEDE